MLPHRSDVLEFPQYSYTEQTLPCLPQCSWLQQFPDVVTRAAVSVANTVTQAAQQNPARTFYYNCCCENNWRNNFFTEAVDFAVSMAVVMASRGLCRHPVEAVDRTAQDTVSLMVSKYIYEFRELQAFCSPEQVNAAFQNMTTLNEQMQAINMMRQGGQLPMQQGYPQPNQGYQQYGQGNSIQVPGRGNPYGQQYQAPGQYPQGNLSYGNNTPQYGAPATLGGHQQAAPEDRFTQRASAMLDRYERVNGNEQPNLKQGEYFQGRDKPLPEPIKAPEAGDPDKKYTIADWKPTASQYCLRAYSYDQKYPTYEFRAGELCEIVDKNFKGIDMDRAAHTLGQPKSYNTGDWKAAFTKLEENVNVMQKTVSATAIEDELVDGSEATAYVWPKVVLTSWLDDMIFVGRQHQRRAQKDNMKNNVFCCFGILAKPYTTFIDVMKYMDSPKPEKFEEVKNFIFKIGYFADHDDDLSESAKASMVSFGIEVNRVMTKYINDFLAIGLSLTGVNIDSFVDDIEGLRSYLKNNHSTRYAEAYDQFEHDLVNRVFAESNYEIAEMQRAALFDPDSEDAENAATLTFLSTGYCLAYLDVLDSDLNLNVQKEPRLLTEGSMPLLFKTAKTVFGKKQYLDMKPAKYLVITRDNVIYEIHKGYLGHEAYMIIKQ